MSQSSTLVRAAGFSTRSLAAPQELGGGTIETKALIIAAGAEARHLPIPTEARFYRNGVSGCATCDGGFFRDKKVVVVGGGNTAIQDAIFLTRFASKVTIVHRPEYLRVTPIEAQKAKRSPKIEWMIPWLWRRFSAMTPSQALS